jgi:hypothetical protein
MMLPLDRSYGHHFPLVASFGQAEHQESDDRNFFMLRTVTGYYAPPIKMSTWCIYSLNVTLVKTSGGNYHMNRILVSHLMTWS